MTYTFIKHKTVEMTVDEKELMNWLTDAFDPEDLAQDPESIEDIVSSCFEEAEDYSLDVVNMTSDNKFFVIESKEFKKFLKKVQKRAESVDIF